jgi:hypothetical protein
MKKENVYPSSRRDTFSIEEVRIALRTDRPEIDPSPVLHALRDFAASRGEATALAVPPSRHEIETYLAEGMTRIGQRYIMANLGNLQIAAPILWGAAHSGIIGQVLRDTRCAPKSPRRSKLEKTRATIERLPLEWQAGLISRLASEPGPARQKWSADHALSVAQATVRWLSWCGRFERDLRPTGVAFHAYACDLALEGVSSASAGDYLSRILSGYRSAVDPGFASAACDHVISNLNAKRKVEGRPTKTGNQIVGASTIFNLGVDIIDGARRLGPRGLAVARDYRNGLLLVTAAAVPQRARALSHFDLGRTVILLDRPYLRIRLPGRALKLREHEKAHGGYDKVIENAVLWDAVEEYARVYRPLFDDGTAMFPSIHEKNVAVSSAQLGNLVGNLTQEHLKVRVTIHRVRDNVATEASEELRGGGYLAPALLDHRSAATTMASYDYAQGMAAARDLAEFIQSRRSRTSTLRL